MRGTVIYVGEITKNKEKWITAIENVKYVKNIKDFSEETLAEDIMDCVAVYVVCDKCHLDIDTRNALGFAALIAKPIHLLSNVTSKDIEAYTARFCLDTARDILSLEKKYTPSQLIGAYVTHLALQ